MLHSRIFGLWIAAFLALSGANSVADKKGEIVDTAPLSDDRVRELEAAVKQWGIESQGIDGEYWTSAKTT